MSSLLMILTLPANTNLTYNTNNTDNNTHTSSNYKGFFSFNSLFVATVLLEHRTKLLAWDRKQAKKEREKEKKT